MRIETDVPAPRSGHRGRLPIYPWRDMQPGTSLVLADHGAWLKAIRAARSWVRDNRPGWRVVTRRGELRIWFTEKAK